MRILIVCRAGDDLGLQARQGIVVNDGAERAGDEYLNWGIVNSIGGDRCRTESALGLAHAAIMDITNQKDSAGIAEASRQVPADIPEPLYGDADNFKSSWPRRSRMAAAATFWKTCDEGGGPRR